ncbi:MAG: Ig-like domain-containing protein [Candidatus Coproplasma sp.]
MKAKIKKLLTAIAATGFICSLAGVGVYSLTKDNNLKDGLDLRGKYSLSAFAAQSEAVALNVAGNSKTIDATETLAIVSNDGSYKLYVTAIDLDDIDVASVEVGYVYDGTSCNGKSTGLGNVVYKSLTVNTGSGTATINASDVGTVTMGNPYFVISEVAYNELAPEASFIIKNTSSVDVIDGTGDLEASYVTWSAATGADWYNVYVKENTATEYTQLDTALVRQYSDYYRADALGLKAGTYSMKIAPTDAEGNELGNFTEVNNIVVEAHDRSGYAFEDGHMPGAYNADGTLKDNAVVVYVTNENKNSISMDVTGAASNPCVGIQNIITGYAKGVETRPLAVRFIGNVEDPANMPNGDLYIDAVTSAGMTIEGVGNDATANGWGIVIKNSVDVEVRNMGVMNVNSTELDDIGLQQGDSYCWVHNNDLFYGMEGSDSDQEKGDGALDTKKSHHITHSYNHFWDNGKCNLQGGTSSDTSNYITYHHNWYDHSDSRHPRVRIATVHIYNNYYDGNAKYGIGATLDSDVFVEANYFRSTSTMKPMMIAGQGTDILDSNGTYTGKSTFSSENGGMIKSYGNVYDTTGGGELALTTYQENNTQFDCYEVENRNDVVPSTVTAYAGGATYNNFDTAADFYEYNVDTAEVAKVKVEKWAGRVGGGDFQWEFDDATDDSSYAVNTALKSALTNYSSSLVKVGDTAITSGGSGSGSESGGETGGETGGSIEADTIIYCADGDSSLNENGVTISGNYKSITVTCNGKSFSPLKMESSTSVTFTLSGTFTMKLYIVADAGGSGAGLKIKVNGTSYTADSEGIVTVENATGDISITKDSTCNLCCIALTSTGGSSETPSDVAVTGVSLNKDSTTIEIGSSETLTATVAPSNATNTAVTWTSSNTSVATVVDGVVTAVTAGEAIITVTTADGSYTATCTVTVPENAGATETATITGVTASASTTSGVVGDSITLSATVSGTGSYDSTVTWTITEGTATISGNTLNLTTAGTVKVQAIANGDNSVKSDVLTITVTESGSESGGETGETTVDDSIDMSKDTSTSSHKISLTSVNGYFTITSTSNYQYGTASNCSGLVATGNGRDLIITCDSTAASMIVTLKLAIAEKGFSAVSSAATITVTKIDGTTETITPTNVVDEYEFTLTQGKTVTIVAAKYIALISASAEVTPTSGSGSSETPSDVAVTGVSLNKTSTTIEIGSSETLTATVAPSNATNTAVTWTSSNTSVATVVDGVVTAVTAGEAIITVTTADGSYTATCTVTVPENAGATETATITGVTASASTTSGVVGDSITLSATVSGTGSYDSTVTWTITEGTATISGNTLNLTTAGTVKVQAIANGDNSVKSDVLTITVTESGSESGGETGDTGETTSTTYTYTYGGTNGSEWSTDSTATADSSDTTPVTGVKISSGNNFKLTASGKKATISLNGFTTGSSSAQPYVTVTFNDANGNSLGTLTGTTTAGKVVGDFTFTSDGVFTSETAFATIEITCNTSGKNFAIVSLSIVVEGDSGSGDTTVSVTGVSLDKENSSLKVGETDTLTATVSPADADNTNIIWSSSDETIATVVNGVVTALKAGTVTITATSAENSGLSASCVYTVSNVAPTSITLNTTSATITVGDTLNLTASVLPSNATFKTVTWSTSNSSVATVDANGKVTAIGTGSVTITATADDASSVKATCAITVKAEIVKVTGIALNYSNENLNVGDTLQLTATVTPDNADDTSVSWSTSNSSIATVSASGFVTVVGEGTVTITATSATVSSVYAQCKITASYVRYTVTFKEGSTTKSTQEVISGETATSYSYSKEGYALEGWYTDSALTNKFNFSTAITSNITLYAKWVESTISVTYSQGNAESAAIEWEDTNASAATVEYKLASASDSAYVAVDSELIRQVDSVTARVDVLGLKGGETYNFKVTSGTNGETVETIKVNSYDRSGYAHFNYTDGVGAYNDDGTLKDNAIVLYVTDENKNTVTLSYGGVTVTGIGNILNSAGDGKGNTNQGILKLLAQNNIPLVVRFIGCVSDSGLYKKATFDASSTPLINGLTIYNSTDNGGAVGDNGHMARIKSGKDVTLEGVGEDATIDGWGFHFMCESSAADLGKSFEVRNLTFINTPEDAIGMEGVQISASASSDLSASVERCWIHNNEFYGPSISNPAESDKAEGDGSCDFKRGQYFTCSYNYFEGCHKTNLVGSADTSLQYNLSYHHNYWYLCKARGPLARNANIHMYNNVFYGQTDYCMNTRANAYIFSEYNLFYMCKSPQRVDSGAIKSYNDSFSSCINYMAGTVVTDKSTTVSNSCQYAYGGVDYSKFDTNSSLSYIPTGDYELQTSVTEARKVMAAFAGVTKRNINSVEDVSMSDVSLVPSGVTPVSISVPSTVTPDKVSKTVYAFTITSAATVTIAYSSDTYASTGVLINEAGECFLTASGTVVLEPGTYMVQPTNIQAGDSAALTEGTFKEITINSISFEVYNSAALNEKLLTDYNTKATLVSEATIAYDSSSYQLIKNAQNAYALLSSDLQAQVTVDYSVVENAFAAYVSAGETYVENLIQAIGTVNANSGSAISAARTAYQELISIAPDATIDNYSTLTAAETEYENYKVTALNTTISNLAAASSATNEDSITSLLAEYQSVQSTYEDLSEEQKAKVENYAKVTEGIATLQAAKVPYDVRDMIAALPASSAVTLSDGSAISAARKAYDALTDDQKTIVGDITKLTAAEAALADLASSTTVAIFTKDDASLATSVGFTVSGSYKSGVSFEYCGTTYNSPLKLESSTSITFTTVITQKVTIKIYTAGGNLNVDGVTYSDTDGDGIILIDSLAAGDHTITKGSGDPNLCYVILEAV